MSLNVVSSFNGVTDPDAGAYIAAVEAADGQLLEFAVGKAINDFVVGCKADGIWSAIKASCILAGARTLNGALVPLVGPAPTNNGFLLGDYLRKTGLGDASNTTKYLSSNRNNNEDPQNNNHNAVYASVAPTGGSNQTLIGNSFSNGGNALQTASNNVAYAVRNRQGSSATPGVTVSGSAGFIGVSRASSSGFLFRAKTITSAEIASVSQTPLAGTVDVFRTLTLYTNARIAFYSIGEAIDLAKLDARVTDLITAFNNPLVIP